MSCFTEMQWSRGTVVALNWRRFDWPQGQAVPYQVELDYGTLIYVPRDSDELCKAVEKAWWEPAFERRAPPERSIFDAPGPYLVVAPTWISAAAQRGSAHVADAYPPSLLQVIEVSVSGERVRGHVLEPDGWMSLRSVDDEKVFAVPDGSAYARCFRQANPALFRGGESSAESDCGDLSCRSSSCAAARKGACGHFSASELRTLAGGARGVDLDQKDERGRTALVAALQMEWLDGVRALLEMGACPNVGDDCSGKRPLHTAIQGCRAALPLLLQARADPNLQDKNPNLELGKLSKSFEDAALHRTPLHYCAETGHLQSVVALLDARASPNTQDAEFMTPLHLAIDEDHEDVVDAILSRRADVNLGNIKLGLDSSPLLNAAYLGDRAMIAKLVGARADVNRKRKCDMTALLIAVRARHEDAARALVAARCDVHHSSRGMTAADFAAKNGMGGLASFLGGLIASSS